MTKTTAFMIQDCDDVVLEANLVIGAELAEVDNSTRVTIRDSIVARDPAALATMRKPRVLPPARYMRASNGLLLAWMRDPTPLPWLKKGTPDV